MLQFPDNTPFLVASCLLIDQCRNNSACDIQVPQTKLHVLNVPQEVYDFTLHLMKRCLPLSQVYFVTFILFLMENPVSKQ